MIGQLLRPAKDYENLGLTTIGDLTVDSDIKGLVVGEGQDAKIYYDGVNTILDMDNVSPSDLVIKCGTDKTLVLEESVWADLYPTAVSAGATGVNVPAITAYNGNLRAYEFVGSVSMKEIFLQFQFPHAYKEYTAIFPHIHAYIPNDITGGNIRIGFEYTWLNVDDLSTTTSTLYVIETISPNAGNYGNRIIGGVGPIVGTGKKISSLFSVRVFRDPTDVLDTFGSSIWLVSSDIHIEVDTHGSRQTLIK